MKIASYALIFLALLLAQITVLPYFAIGSFIPDVLLIGIIILALREGGVAAMITACATGLARDAFTTSFLGSSMLGLVIAAFLTGIYAKNHQRMGIQANLISLFVIVFAYNTVFYLLHLLDTRFTVGTIMINFVLPAAFYTIAIAGIAHYLLPRGLWGKGK